MNRFAWKLHLHGFCAFSTALLLLAGFGMPEVSRAVPDESRQGECTTAAGPPDFVQAEGRRLCWNGEPVLLRGVNFSNYYELKLKPQQLLDSNHHGPEDFARIADWGMNAVRFAFKGEWYEQDPEGFFAWIDRNLEWAGQAGIFLILDLHVPIGGFWLDPTGVGAALDFSIWNDPRLQERNLAMWRAIAERYRDEPRLAAYDILNEPVTTDSDGSQWRAFANRLVDSIREVDPDHLLIVGKLYGVDDGYTTGDARVQFLVDDPNVMYDFHFYQPIDYTHQYASWIDRPMGDGGSYPDPEVVVPTGRQRYITSLAQENPRPMALDSDWQRLAQPPYRVEDPRIAMGVPIFVASRLADATVWFDHFTVTEHDGEGRRVRTVIEEPLSDESVWNWWSWHAPQEGRKAVFTRVQNDGVNDSHSLAITDARGADGVSGWTSDHLWFPVRQGYSYQISGHLRAERDGDSGTPIKAYFDVAFYGDPVDGGPGFIRRDRSYLEREFKALYRFGVEHDVPMSVMEFGLMRHAFEMDGKGGSRWVSDVIDLLSEHQVSFAYWNYHGDRMGIYLDRSGEPPTTPNEALIRTLRQKLRHSTPAE